MTDTSCLAWYVTSEKRLPFEGAFTAYGNPKQFYLPIRCRKDVKKGEKVCERCSNYKKKEKGYTGVGLYWGLVTEPIQNLSKRTNQIAFSPWFLEMVKEHGISPENLQKAKDAWIVATVGLNDVPPLPDMEAKPTENKKKIKVKVKPEAKPDAKPEAKPDAKPEAKKKRQQKTVASVQPVFVVSSEKPEEVDTVVEIPVIKMEINDCMYYVDTAKSKVYDIKTGAFKGRWDSALNKMVTDRPDSDVES
jgi:hypothetical protein